MYRFFKISFKIISKLTKTFFRLFKKSFKLFRLSMFAFCFIINILICSYITTPCFAVEAESFTDKLEFTGSIDTSKAEDVVFTDDFNSAEHLCCVTFTYYCDNLNNSIVLYIEDINSGKLYRTTTYVLDSGLTNDSIYFTKSFNLPNGEYRLYVGFTGLPLNDEDTFTYMPSSSLTIHNNSTASISAVVTRNENFLCRAKNIILLDPLYTPIAEDILSDILLLEQKGKIYTSEEIYNSGVVTQYNQYKENKYTPSEPEYFEEVSVITPTKCEINPSVDIYIEHYENLTNDEYIKNFFENEATRVETTTLSFMPTTTAITTTINNQLSNNSSEKTSMIETTSIKPFATLEKDSSTSISNINNKNTTSISTPLIVFIISFLAIIIGGIVCIILKRKNTDIDL